MTIPSETIEIELFGHVPSKKNAYTPRKDKPGFFKNSDLQGKIDQLAMKVPGHLRDLKLVHPDIEFHFTYTKANWDRDGAVTTLLDILKTMGVLVDDNINNCNGMMQVFPAVRGEFDKTLIVLTPANVGSSPRYVRPKPKRRTPLFAHSIPDADASDFRDFDEDDD